MIVKFKVKVKVRGSTALHSYIPEFKASFFSHCHELYHNAGMGYDISIGMSYGISIGMSYNI